MLGQVERALGILCPHPLAVTEIWCALMSFFCLSLTIRVLFWLLISCSVRSSKLGMFSAAVTCHSTYFTLFEAPLLRPPNAFLFLNFLWKVSLFDSWWSCTCFECSYCGSGHGLHVCTTSGIQLHAVIYWKTGIFNGVFDKSEDKV